MANSIAKCKQYVNSQVEHLDMFERNMRLADLLVKPTEWKGATFSYDVYSFASYTMGTFSNGVSQKDFTCTRVDKTLSQDRGDSLTLDIRDKNEGQIADGLAGMYNFYQIKVEIPTIEKYALAQMVSPNNGIVKLANGELSTSNIVSKLNAVFKQLKNKRVKVEECILYISTSAKSLLDEAVFGKGIIKIGEWNGNADANTEMYKGAKVVEIDDDTMQGADFVLVHPFAFSILDLLGLVNVFDYVPSKPGIGQIDVRDYFDAWVEPNATDGIGVVLGAPNKLTLTENDDHSVSVTGVQPGAKVYYKTSAGATSSDTELTAVSGVYTIATPLADTHYYVVQYIGSVKSAEADIAIDV